MPVISYTYASFGNWCRDYVKKGAYICPLIILNFSHSVATSMKTKHYLFFSLQQNTTFFKQNAFVWNIIPIHVFMCLLQRNASGGSTIVFLLPSGSCRYGNTFRTRSVCTESIQAWSKSVASLFRQQRGLRFRDVMEILLIFAFVAAAAASTSHSYKTSK